MTSLLLPESKEEAVTDLSVVDSNVLPWDLTRVEVEAVRDLSLVDSNVLPWNLTRVEA